MFLNLNQNQNQKKKKQNIWRKPAEDRWVSMEVMYEVFKFHAIILNRDVMGCGYMDNSIGGENHF